VQNIWRSTLSLALLAASSAWAADISIGINIGTPPPPPRVVYYTPARPGPDYVWVAGYWYPEGPRYAWHAGFWSRPPYEGGLWIGPRWEGGRYYAGRWERHDNGLHRGWDRDHDKGRGRGHGRRDD